jgi:hypothetical protein
MAQDWDIQLRGEGCRVCDTPFADKQPYFSSLTFGEEGYARADYCERCWSGRSDDASPYSAWQGVFHLPPPPPEEALKKETAESLLRKLMEDDNPLHLNVIYILAIMLERKRILIERDVRTSDTDTLMRVYEHRKSGESFVVADPRLKFEALETVQEEVVVMLGGKPRKVPDGDQSVESSGDSAITDEKEAQEAHHEN